MGILKDGPDFDRILFTARLALVYAFAYRLLRAFLWFQLVGSVFAPAMRADRAFWPKLLFKEGPGFSFVGKKLGKRRQVEKCVAHRLLLVSR